PRTAPATDSGERRGWTRPPRRSVRPVPPRQTGPVRPAATAPSWCVLLFRALVLRLTAWCSALRPGRGFHLGVHSLHQVVLPVFVLQVQGTQELEQPGIHPLLLLTRRRRGAPRLGGRGGSGRGHQPNQQQHHAGSVHPPAPSWRAIAAAHSMNSRSGSCASSQASGSVNRSSSCATSAPASLRRGSGAPPLPTNSTMARSAAAITPAGARYRSTGGRCEAAMACWRARASLARVPASTTSASARSNCAARRSNPSCPFASFM